MANDKLAWRKAVSEQRFPVGLRPVKATLLALPMTPDGLVSAWRDQLTEATGLPMGTLKRHLARAVAAGWLLHKTHGGHGRRGIYRAAFPPSCGPLMARNLESCGPPTTPQLGEVVAHVVSQSVTDSASVSEHVALDPTKTKGKGAAKGAPRDASTQPDSPSDSSGHSFTGPALARDAGVRGRRVPGNPDVPQADHVLEPSPAGTVCECGTADVASGADVCIGCFVNRIAQRRKKATA
jgi:hypothetical protein